MKVSLKHKGLCRVDTESPYEGSAREYEYVHRYFALADSGWAGEIADDKYVHDGVYDLPDDMFQLDSGNVHWVCDECGHEFWQRSRPGGKVKCEMCGFVSLVPTGIVLEDDVIC